MPHIKYLDARQPTEPPPGVGECPPWSAPDWRLFGSCVRTLEHAETWYNTTRICAGIEPWYSQLGSFSFFEWPSEWGHKTYYLAEDFVEPVHIYLASGALADRFYPAWRNWTSLAATHRAGASAILLTRPYYIEEWRALAATVHRGGVLLSGLRFVHGKLKEKVSLVRRWWAGEERLDTGEECRFWLLVFLCCCLFEVVINLSGPGAFVVGCVSPSLQQHVWTFLNALVYLEVYLIDEGILYPAVAVHSLTHCGAAFVEPLSLWLYCQLFMFEVHIWSQVMWLLYPFWLAGTHWGPDIAMETFAIIYFSGQQMFARVFYMHGLFSGKFRDPREEERLMFVMGGLDVLSEHRRTSWYGYLEVQIGNVFAGVGTLCISLILMMYKNLHLFCAFCQSLGQIVWFVVLKWWLATAQLYLPLVPLMIVSLFLLHCIVGATYALQALIVIIASRFGFARYAALVAAPDHVPGVFKLFYWALNGAWLAFMLLKLFDPAWRFVFKGVLSNLCAPIKRQASLLWKVATRRPAKKVAPEAGDVCYICHEIYGEEDAGDFTSTDLAHCVYGCGRAVAHAECLALVHARPGAHQCLICSADWPAPPPRRTRAQRLGAWGLGAALGFALGRVARAAW